MTLAPQPFDVEPSRDGVVLGERYRLGAPLSAGSMGAVYRAEDVTTGGAVAVKILRAHLGDNDEAVSRFAREAALGRRVEHPNCVGVTDAGVCDDGAIYLVMELLDGESLGAVLDREHTLPWRRALAIMRHVLRGLDHAHARGVVHRDIKPDNIFLCPDERDPDFARVLDFGIAKLVGAMTGPALTQAGLTIGTPSYLSPEQATGAALDGRSDLYSVSAVLFELLTGRPPFADGDVVRVLTAHATEPAPRFADVVLDHGVPAAVEALVLEGLAKAPDARMQTAAAYVERIDALLAPVVIEASAPAEPGPGTMIDGRYRLDKLLGRGGMGQVFAATHLGLARRVAIKLLDRRTIGDDDTRRRFEREAQASGRLQHANCVGVTDFGVDSSASRYLVMELVEGETLDDLLADQPRLPVKRAVDIMRQLLAGLGHAHAHGVVHRDLKPANVMLVRGPDGRDVVKVLDFGLARIVDGANERITRTGIVCGTPRYMAPEQVLDRGLDRRADLYAASVIFFEMLAGRTPFDADDALQILKLHLDATPPTIAEVAPDAVVPAAVEQVIRRGLAKAPDDRPATADQYLADLDRACKPDDSTIELSAGMLSELRVGGPPPLPGRVTRRQIAIAGACAAVLLIGVIAAVAGGSSDAAGSSSAARAVEPEPEIEIDPMPARSTDPAVVQALGLAAAGRGEQAVAQLKDLRKRRPKDAQIPYGLGRVYLKLNWPKPAIEAFHDAIALDGSLREDPHVIRGLIGLLDSQSAWQAAAKSLEHDVGAPAKPALTKVAASHASPTVRARAQKIVDQL